MRYTIHTDNDITYYGRMETIINIFGPLSQYLTIVSSSTTYHNGKWSSEITVEVKPGFESKVENLIVFI